MKTIDVKTATTAELVAHYNAHSGKPPVKKFQDRATAEKRVAALVAAAPTPAPAPAKPKKERRKEEGTATQRVVAVKPPSKRALAAQMLSEGRCPHCGAGADQQSKAGREGEPLHGTHSICGQCGVTYNRTSGHPLTGIPERSVAVAASWANAEVAAKRAQRDSVLVDGKPYRSVKQAFEELGLQVSKHIKFRQELKEKGHASFEGHKFKIAPAQ